ncbi:uncharacterized protein KY384_007292 [Bacidia gigantensis]|uniref:uncharacterized protein n=1 Tax=Bacidia gigantensis TaxID=2732470 RepID=UPI001D04DF49|nr:uncharacterized protein KY384_007292 [Bacidia gigantensis]KAG8528374.1 hypothetical protein KY384_007292 [Bacidia gigantensis]
MSGPPSSLPPYKSTSETKSPNPDTLLSPSLHPSGDIRALPPWPLPISPARRSFVRSEQTLVAGEMSSDQSPRSSSQGLDPEKAEAPPLAVFKADFTVYMAFTAIAVLTLMVALDSTALSVALPVIAQKLKGDALEAFWSATAYLLTSTVFQPTTAALSDVFGRKWVTFASALLFLAGIIIAGNANDFIVLLTGRTIQGIGGGAVEVLAQLIICDLIPLRIRGQWFGVISAMYSVGTVSGPLLGGVFAQKVTWRWIFWINLPFVGASIIMTPIFIRLGASTDTSLFQRFLRIDWIGSALFIAAFTSLLIPLSWGGVQYPWDSWHTIVPLIMGPIGLVLLYIYESHYAANPIIRTNIFKSRNAVIAYVTVIIHGLVVTTILYYLPLYYQAAKGLDPIISAVALFPETFTIAPGAFVVGALIARFNSYRWSIWSGWAITTVGVGVLYLLDEYTSTAKWILLNLVVGIGIGFNYVAIGVMLQAAVPEEDMTSAIALFTVFRPFGQALGVAIGGVIFQNRFRAKLAAIPEFATLASHYANDASGLAQVIQAMTGGGRKDTLLKAYTDSLKMIWGVLCAFSGVALILSIPIKSISLDREFEPVQKIGNQDTPATAAVNASSTEKEIGKMGSDLAKRSSTVLRNSTVGSRPHQRSSAVDVRNSHRYSREIGGFHSFPVNLTQPRVYAPARNSRPDSLLLLPFPEEQPSLATMIDGHFGRKMEEGRF